MELISYEVCRIVRLMAFRREHGSIYFPEAAAKLVARYSFAKYPTLEESQQKVMAPGPAKTVMDTLTKRIGIPYLRSAVAFDCDPEDVPGRRKPWRLFVERKVGFPLKENIFLCQAPIATGELLDLLTKVEQQAG